MVTMSMSRVYHRRIVRREDSVDAPLVSLSPWHGSVMAGHLDGPEESVAQARRQGWQEGYDAAMAEFTAAEEAGRAAQLRRMADSLTSSADLVAAVRREAIALGEVEVVELACQLAEAILERELGGTRPAMAAVTRALRLIPEGEDLVVRVNPDDVLSVEEIQELVPESTVRILADPAIELGGCVVVAGACQVDAQIGPALTRARQVLEDLHLARPLRSPGGQE